METMVHPSARAILIGGDPAVDAHLARCELCRRLVALGDRSSAGPVGPATVDPGLYSARQPLDAVGGMSRTERAWDRRLARDVVIKEASIPPSLPASSRDALRERFVREARVTARLAHPGIVAVHELGEWPGGEPFYTMPLVAGVPLDRAIARCTSARDRLALVANVAAAADALAYAHSHGVIHRDVKPANIILGEFGETVVLDWGLAKRIDESADEAADAAATAAAAAAAKLAGDGLTVFGAGTPQYMPPEQARGEEPDPRVDVYALGATLYHVLAGTPPYGSGDAEQLRRQLRELPPPPLAELAPDAPPDLIAICTKAMARERAARYPSAVDLASDLRRVLSGGLATAHRYSAAEVVRLWLRRHRTPVRVAAVALAALVTLGTVAVINIVRERDRADREARVATSALAQSQAARASLLASGGATRVDAVEVALTAAAPALAAKRPLSPDVWQGLVDAVSAGPFAVPLADDASASVLAYSPTGERFATFGGGSIRLWNGRTGRLLSTHATSIEGAVVQAAFSPDGSRLAIAEAGGKVELWHGAIATRIDGGPGQVVFAFGDDGTLVVAGGEGLLQMLAPTATAVTATTRVACHVSRVAVAGRSAVMGCNDGGLWAWDLAGRTLQLAAHAGLVNTVAVSADAMTLWTGASDGTMRAWDVAAIATALAGGGAPTPRTIWSDPRPYHGVRVSPDGTWLAVAVGIWLVYDLAAGDTRVIGTNVEPPDGEWPRGARRVFGVSNDGPVVIDVATRMVLAEVRGHRTAARRRVVGSPDATRALYANELGETWLWDTRLGAASGVLPQHEGEVVAIAARDGQVRSLGVGGSLRTLRDMTGETVEVGQFDAEIVVASTVGDVMVAGGSDGIARIWRGNAAIEELRATASAPATPAASGTPATPTRTATGRDAVGPVFSAAAVSAVAIADDGRVAAGDVAGRVVVRSHAAGTGGADVRFTVGDGRVGVAAFAFGPSWLAVAAGESIAIRLPDRLMTLPASAGSASASAGSASAGAATALLVAPSGRMLAIGRGARTELVETTTWTQVAGADGRPLAWVGDDVLAVASATGEVSLWRTPSMASAASPAVHAIGGHGRPITAAALSHDRAWLVTGDVAGGVRVWDLARSSLAFSIDDGGRGAVTAIALAHQTNAASDAIVVGHVGGAVRLHPLTVEGARLRACQVLAAFDRRVQGACP